jgi:N-dimethylarginine dimethylaminohydrolase
MKAGAKAEYGRLKKVIMYRPGQEVAIVTDETKSEFLYREAVDWKILRRQHDEFVSLLESEGVEVMLINDFLDDTSIEGLPNLTFSRDVCSVTERGAILGSMARQARRREPEVYEFALKKMGVPILVKMRNPLEGGDFVYLTNNTLLLGWGPRTSFEGALEISEILLEGIVTEVVAIKLPGFRVHLDGGMMALSPGIALIHKPSFTLPATILRKGEREETHLIEYLSRRGFSLLEVPEDESCTFGSNVVCLGKDKLVSYSWNRKTLGMLEREGFDVITLDGDELAKAGGGPHCLTCPLLRE